MTVGYCKICNKEFKGRNPAETLKREYCSQKCFGIAHRGFSFKHTEKAKKAISESLKEQYKTGKRKPLMCMKGIPRTEEVKRKISKANKGQKRPLLQGKNNWNWKGGISYFYDKVRKSDKYKQWRRDIFIRDEFTCWECGHKYIKINAHHIYPYKDFPDLRFDRNNGITLCYSCHCKLHKPAKKEK